ncbi:AMP-binding protein [Clostridium frigoris]|uniref:AMP-binding protein n=1 Tax=Clostridium frigoris TaxID=205327 RepID=A0ABS6BVI6_9CLOT|nr:AMP-binding protein [Clostridium frigoris]MBU3159852.1 AMP-binding protein [Clostridium frigoris]
MAVIDFIKKVYIHVPIRLINLAAPIYYLIPDSIRYGSTFKKQKKFLKTKEFLSESEQANITNQNFVELINYCYQNVPYYHELFDNNGLKVDTFKTVSDIKRIPFLTKEILRERMDDLIADGTDRNKLLLITSSGTTGTPIGVYVDHDSTMIEWAYTLHIWRRVGYKLNSSRVVLRGKHFREEIIKGKCWQYDALRRELSCNIHDMCEDNLEQYCVAIEKYKPEFIHGYPSAIYTLCLYIKKRGLEHQFKAVLAVSETIITEQRKIIEEVLKTRIFAFYGHSERLIMAGECEYSNKYHVEPQYGIAEIVDENGEIITNNTVGELVATGFSNRSMPLLRYKTGDLANWSEQQHCECNRHYKLIEQVLGRKKEVLINKVGIPVLLTSMHYEFFEEHVKQFKFYQEEIGKVKLIATVDMNYSDEDEKSILKTLEGDTRGSIDFEVVIVNELSAKSSGKREMVIQKLDTRQMGIR